MDVGREVGSAVFLANEDRNVRVDLTDPDVIFYVEVRENRAYIFDSYMPGPGGLPMGSQGKVLAVVNSDRDALAAWLIMKRGCKAFILTDDPEGPARSLDRWDPRLTMEIGGSIKEVLHHRRAMALVLGSEMDDIDPVNGLEVPIFYPLVGLSPEEISVRISQIKVH